MPKESHGSVKADKRQKVPPIDLLAGIEYVGVAGISKECQDGVSRLLQYGDQITHARILSSPSDHCLLLSVNCGDIVAVKSGFTSGYLGEGPRTFSYVLEVLQAQGVNIEEYTVSPEMIERLDMSSLTSADLKTIDTAKPVRGSRWRDYLLENHWVSICSAFFPVQKASMPQSATSPSEWERQWVSSQLPSHNL
jgi:hypothetical protein